METADLLPQNPEKVTLPLSGEQVSWLDELALEKGLSKAEILRRGLVLVGEDLERPFPHRLRIV